MRKFLNSLLVIALVVCGVLVFTWLPMQQKRERAEAIAWVKSQPSLIVKYRTTVGPVDIYHFSDALSVLLVNYNEPGMKEAFPRESGLSTLYYYIHPSTHKLTLAAFDIDGDVLFAGQNEVGWYLIDPTSDSGHRLLSSWSIPRAEVMQNE